MYAMLFVYVRKPEYRGPSKIEWLNPASLKRLVLEPKDDDKKVSWLVEFYASWSPAMCKPRTYLCWFEL
jgi:hypothetical protein